MVPAAFIDLVIQKTEALTKSGLWGPMVRPGAWLANFSEIEDKLIAALLLDQFVFFSDRVTNRLLAAAFKNSEDDFAANCDPQHGSLQTLAVFTSVNGGPARPTDSGNMFCRKARQVLEIDEDRIVEPAEALRLASEGHPVVFLDDFVGSGDQFIATWNREYRETFPKSFVEWSSKFPVTAFYVCAIATKTGEAAISAQAPEVSLTSAHVMGPEYSVQNLTASALAPAVPTLSSRVDTLLQKFAPRLNLPGYMRLQEAWSKYGYHNLGALLAFEHGVPDASVPLIWAPGSEGWTPLVKRT